MKAVVNATPLIALSLIGHFDLLRQLFESIYVPRSVFEEVSRGGRDRPGGTTIQTADWLIIQSPSQSSAIPMSLVGLDQGEQDVLLLGQELKADWLIIDERLGRRFAQAMNFKVKGTLGILLAAYQSNRLTKVKAENAIHQLNQSNIRLSPRLIDWFQKQLNSK